jgi:hypothetical protein
MPRRGHMTSVCGPDPMVSLEKNVVVPRFFLLFSLLDVP